MSLEKYRNMYLDCIHRYINKTSDKPDHKIYEYLYAIELGLIIWDDLPPDFNERFDIPHKMDYGVDLVNLDYTIACQVKKYENTYITWTDLCKFRTYASDILECKDIILATTTSAKIDKLGQKKLIDTCKMQLIRNNFNDLLEKYSDKMPKKQMKKIKHKIEKRTYLLECYDVIVNSENKKVKCQLPCGCGKTFIILYTIQQELKEDKDLKFIIFVPWLDLAEQTMKLCEQFCIGCVVIGNGNTKIEGDYNVIICINPSVTHIDKKIKFRYKFIDEAHHLENNDSKIKKKIEKIRADKEIHFSATFRVINDVNYNYSLRNAINDGWISDYILHLSFFTDGCRMDAMIKMIMDKTEYFPMFVYFNSTDRCKQFYEKLKNENIRADYLDGNSSCKKRLNIKNRLCSDKLDILSLCGVYNEGVSIDNIKTVMFGDLRHSDINKVQIMMRACRLHKSKPFYRVIIPTNDEDMSGSDMKEIVQTFCKIDPNMRKAITKKSTTRIIIDGLNMNDIENAELQYEQIYNSIGDFISGNREDKWYSNLEKVKKFIDKEQKRPFEKSKNQYEKSLGGWVSTQTQKYNKEIRIMRDKKIRKCWKKFINDEKYNEYFMSNVEIWYANLEKVKKFIDKEQKHPSNKNQYETSLGNWVSNQKKNYDKEVKIMNDKKIRKCWEKFVGDEKYREYLMSNDERWYANLEKVKKFIDKEKKRPFNTSKNQDEKILGKWVSHQITNSNKKNFIMSNKKIRECWEKFVGDEKYKEYFISNDEIWYANLEKVKKFIDKEKKRPTTRGKNQDEKYLGNWVSNQMTRYNKEIKIMRDKKIRECWRKFVSNEKYKKYFTKF